MPSVIVSNVQLYNIVNELKLKYPFKRHILVTNSNRDVYVRLVGLHPILQTSLLGGLHYLCCFCNICFIIFVICLLF
jgi:hypothetical protein